MESLNVELTPGMLLLIPLVGALIQVLKDKVLVVKSIPKGVSDAIKGFLPFISIGISFGFLCYVHVPKPLLPAVMIGLSACGGYDLVKGKKPKSSIIHNQ